MQMPSTFKGFMVDSLLHVFSGWEKLSPDKSVLWD